MPNNDKARRQPAEDAAKGGLTRSFTSTQLALIAMGSIIGAGFFLGSGIPIRHAGRAAVLAYLLGGFLMYLIVSLLAEMEAAHPVEGGFSTYAEEYYGRWIGFVSGWMYWSAGVLTMSSEVVAAAIFTHLWLPHWPLWVFALVYSALMVLINTRDTSGFAVAEGALSALKLVATALFVLLAAAVLSGIYAPPDAVAAAADARSNLLSFGRLEDFLPQGPGGFFGALLFVMFAYAGTSVIAMAAAETRDPERTVPRAIRLVVTTVLALYLTSIAVITVFIPPERVGTSVSPFVQVLDSLRLSWTASLMNLVILTAALSSMNSALYAVTRMLHSLGKRGDAPARLAKVNRHGVPSAALAISTIALALTISLAYVLPKAAYVLISGATSLVAMFNWGLIALTHLRFRTRQKASLPVRMWGHPWTSYLAFALVALVAASAWFLPNQRVGLVGLLILFAVFSGVYWLRLQPRHRRA